jgi:hypothetical protein
MCQFYEEKVKAMRFIGPTIGERGGKIYEEGHENSAHSFVVHLLASITRAV